MKKIRHIYIYTLVIILLAHTQSVVFGEELVILGTDKQVESVYLGGTWKCDWTMIGQSGLNQSGTSEIIYEQASLKKLIGKISNSNCQGGWGKISGKVKGKAIRQNVNRLPNPCFSRLQQEKIYINESGNYISKGSGSLANARINFSCKKIIN